MDKLVDFELPPKHLSGLLARIAMRLRPLLLTTVADARRLASDDPLTSLWPSIAAYTLQQRSDLHFIDPILARYGTSGTLDSVIRRLLAISAPSFYEARCVRTPIACAPAFLDTQNLSCDAVAVLLVADCAFAAPGVVPDRARASALVSDLISGLAETTQTPSLVRSLAADAEVRDTLSTTPTVDIDFLGSQLPTLWSDGTPFWSVSPDYDWHLDLMQIKDVNPANPHIGRGFGSLVDVFGC